MLPIINDTLSVRDITSRYRDLMEGMYSPRVVILNGGRIFKFTSSRIPVSNQPASPWWFRESDFQKLQTYLRLDPGNPGFIARLQAAVKYQWSEMDMLLTAVITHPIRVFVGPGKWQMERTAAGSTITFQPPDDLMQTYLPNIVDSASRTLNSDGQRALRIVAAVRLGGDDVVDRAIKTLPGKNIIVPGNPKIH